MSSRQEKKRTYTEALSPDLEVPVKKRCITEATESPESTAREDRKRMNTEALSPTLDVPAKKQCIEEASEGPEDSGRSEPDAAASTDFYQLLEHPQIGHGLGIDSCRKLTDKYLLAMVKVYFQRAKLEEEEYTPMNFFAALFLANEMEEETDFHDLIYPWGLGDKYPVKWQELRSNKLELWARMGFKAWVSRSSCEEAMEDNPTHWAWKRERHHNHGLVIRFHARKRDYFYFNIPNISPAICSQCAPKPPTPEKVRPRQGVAIQDEDEENVEERQPISSTLILLFSVTSVLYYRV
ncbi:speedy protein 1-A-like [Xenopus laevis]|uniref:Speedy protein 1-A-like n=1 Tax=Xenopus laevis TaxID=8355 RepID=A0A8J1KMQ7_XENLA|nr:speedy protein 1-A-like [Xenopus laevis]